MTSAPNALPDVLTDGEITGRSDSLRLVPLTREHAPALAAAATPGGDEVFAHLSYHPPTTVEAAIDVIDFLTSRPDSIAFAQVIAETGEFVGCTTFYEINPALQALAIGNTWIAQPWWRTWVNTTAKLIMMHSAFEHRGCERVVWHTDIRNERSQQAIARLGATREGVLRHHKRRRDESWRDTVQFSLLAQEWPAVRARLLQILAERSNSATSSKGISS